ncbi:MAG: SDR family oxidoreductase [Acidimicrobiales bacterium]|jgi:3-oxoacyl-[acyl-carrier protein] reductase|nr:SDR family oxidoreductase [Acidimicrobiales bacterium]
MFDLSGKVALVTGAGQGMGAGIALALAAQGAAVAVNDLHAERAEAMAARAVAAGCRAAPAVADVTDPVAIAAMVRRVEEELGPVDVLVHNAGVPAAGFPVAPFAELDPALWTRFVDLNLYGLLHCVRAVLPGMAERGWGRIVYIASEAGRVGNGMGISLYSAAKAGGMGFCRALSQEVGPHGVTVNSLALGLMDNAVDPGPGVVGGPAKRVPVRRSGAPADVGSAVVYLASDEASWVTGQTLGVNGGVVTS